MSLLQLGLNDRMIVPFVLERKLLSFTENICPLQRIGDLVEPLTIMCYDCNDEFAITKVKLIIGSHTVINIDDAPFFEFLHFKECLTIDGKNHILYHLDRTKLFFKIKLIAMQYSDSHIIVSTTGSCAEMKLNCEYSYLDNRERRPMQRNSYRENIKQFVCTSITNYHSLQEYNFHMSNTINGFLLTDIDHTKINSIQLNLNGVTRFSYENKLALRLNTTQINENTIYLFLNNAPFDSDINASSLETRCLEKITLQLGLDHEESIDFKIGCYTNNILTIDTGEAYFQYLYSDSISTGSRRRSRISTWSSESKSIEGNDECPVLHEHITEKYVTCHECKKNFDASIIESWIDLHKTCPMCRTTWTNRIIYSKQSFCNRVFSSIAAIFERFLALSLGEFKN